MRERIRYCHLVRSRQHYERMHSGVRADVHLTAKRTAQPTPNSSEPRTPESEIAPEVRKTGRSWVDLSAAVSALLISVTSLWVAVRHGHTMERMADANARLVAANSYPLLHHFQSSAADLHSPDYTVGKRVASLNIVNSGVGPA